MTVLRTSVCFPGVLCIGLLAGHASFAADLYVDNRIGDDIYDGRSKNSVDERSGPVRSIGRALKYSRRGDTVHVANHGVPYFESLEIVGPRFSSGFTLDGNGAVVSGARPIPYHAWRPVGNEIWRFTPYRKAFYQLLSADSALPEVPCPGSATRIPEIPPGCWCAWRGSIYYHNLPKESLSSKYEQPLSFAAEETGITLLDVSDATIRNLELKHFRLDGINAHDRFSNVILENVRLTENGRTGLAVGGSSLVGLKDSTVERNRIAQVLNSERAQTEILSSILSPTSVLAGEAGSIRILGGHVLVDGNEVFESRPER